MKPGFKTSEFTATVAGMFLVSLLALLASFDVIHVSEEQEKRIMDFAQIALVALPAVYTLARAHVKGKAASPKSVPPAVAGGQETKVQINT